MAMHLQQQQQHQPRQHKQKKQASRSKPVETSSPGSNWKSAGLAREHHRRKPSNKRKATKKASSNLRDSKVLHVAIASPRKHGRGHAGHAQHANARRSFPRGSHQQSVSASEGNSGANSATAPPMTNATNLDDEIFAFAHFVALSPPERAFRTRLFNDLKALICSTFPHATVELYGSSSNGLDTFRSDLDITVGNIELGDSLRADVQNALADRAAGVHDSKHGDSDSDSDDTYEDERDSDRAPSRACQALSPVDDDETASFSLNIATSNGRSHSAWTQRSTTTAAATAVAGKSPWNPTLRRKKLRVLRALQYLLQLERPSLVVKCLPKAKIPILMVVDPTSQLTIDIGVNREAFDASDHGRSTALVLELQQLLGASFTALVVVLKEFLHQLQLDKPFTGGLGSFRLYVMVATLFPLERCEATGRVCMPQSSAGSNCGPTVSTLLLTFLDVFGNKRHPNHLTSATVLRLPIGECRVDFASVFRLDDVVDAFAMAHAILHKTQSLGAIVFEERLVDDRHRVRHATTTTTMTATSTTTVGRTKASRGNRRNHRMRGGKAKAASINRR